MPIADTNDEEDHNLANSPAGTDASFAPMDVTIEADISVRRPNRYFGPESTWNSWTEQDRLVAELLDQERSRDLSLHLLNAHSLRRKAEQELSRASQARPGRRRASSANSNSVQSVSITQPSRRWSAWPLAPSDVPRDSEDTIVDVSTMTRSTTGSQPSDWLEQSIVASTTGMATARWRQREWQTADPEHTTPELGALDADEKPNSRRGKGSDLSDAAETLSSGSEPDHDSDAPAIYSQTWLADETTPEIQSKTASASDKANSEDEDEREDQAPTPMADDDEARNLLLPSVRHILSKLDDLLIGLHKARQAYAPNKRKSIRDRETSRSDEDSARISTSRSRSRARRAMRSTSRNSESSTTSKRSGQSDAPDKLLGLRDWSDVVGMAALTGWDPAVVERASERCAKLFNENMIFRTFHEDKDGHSSHSEHYATALADTGSENDSGSGSVILIRSTAACELCVNSSRECEPADARIGYGPCKRCVQDGNVCSGIGARTSKPARCPFNSCERHHIPFRKKGHLQRHIEAVHSDTRAPPTPSPARSSASEGVLASTDLPVCPVESCPRHENPFSEGSKMYRHLRRMHPEVDVEEVKRLEVIRRGERRGGWGDENRRRDISRRYRSKSRGLPSSPLTGNTRASGEVD